MAHAKDFDTYSLFDTEKSEKSVPGICAFCLDSLSGVIQDCLVCKGSFHGDCLQAWLLMGSKCPLCNADPMKFSENRAAGLYFQNIAESHITKCEYCNTSLSPVTLPSGESLETVGEVLTYHYQNCFHRSQLSFQKHAETALTIEALAQSSSTIKAVNLKLESSAKPKCYLINTPDKKSENTTVSFQLSFRNHKTVKTRFAVSCKLVSDVNALRFPMRFGIVIHYKGDLFTKLLVFKENGEELQIAKQNYTIPAVLKTFGVVF